MKIRYPKPEKMTAKTVRYWTQIYNDYHGIRIYVKDEIYYLVDASDKVERYFNREAVFSRAQKLLEELSKLLTNGT